MKNNYVLPISIFVSAVILAGAWVYTTGLKASPQEANLEESVLPPGGVILPVRWGDLGAQLVSTGVIDRRKIETLYAARGGLSKNEQKLLGGTNDESLSITPENSGFLLNLLWALGLGAENRILREGPMGDPRYGGAGNFASTGGWTLSQGDPSASSGQVAMEHYSRHPFITLDAREQALVERVSKNIYRPCCGNAVHFPDCNHGMAMLGLLELMASQGVGEEDMYRAALRVNAYWFPDTYLTIAQYLASNSIAWEKADPKELLGVNYSSASGYREILSQVTEPAKKSSGGCSI